MLRCPDAGYRPISIALKVNHKRVRRVMKKFGLKPARRAKAPRKPQDQGQPAKDYPCVTKLWSPIAPNLLWVSDFTYVPFHGKFLYLATILDGFTGEVLAATVMTSHNTELILRTILQAAKRERRFPEWFHSDQGSEYSADEITSLLLQQKVKISMSPKSSPWRNPMQESFYGRFKIALGDPDRFEELTELVEYLYYLVHHFTFKRIKNRLKATPHEFRQRWEKAHSTALNSSPQLMSLPPPNPLPHGNYYN